MPFHYLHYFTAKNEGFFVELGPGLGYYFGATFVDSEPNTKNSLFTFLEFNAHGAVGYKMGRYAINTFYQRSLNNINELSSSGINNNFVIRNASFGVSFNYFI